MRPEKHKKPPQKKVLELAENTKQSSATPRASHATQTPVVAPRTRRKTSAKKPPKTPKKRTSTTPKTPKRRTTRSRRATPSVVESPQTVGNDLGQQTSPPLQPLPPAATAHAAQSDLNQPFATASTKTREGDKQLCLNIVAICLALISIIAVIIRDINYLDYQNSDSLRNDKIGDLSKKWIDIDTDSQIDIKRIDRMHDEMKKMDGSIEAIENAQQTQISDFNNQFKDLETKQENIRAELLQLSNMESKTRQSINAMNGGLQENISNIYNQINDILVTVELHNNATNTNQLQASKNQIENSTITMQANLIADVNDKIQNLAENQALIETRLQQLMTDNNHTITQITQLKQHLQNFETSAQVESLQTNVVNVTDEILNFKSKYDSELTKHNDEVAKLQNELIGALSIVNQTIESLAANISGINNLILTSSEQPNKDTDINLTEKLQQTVVIHGDMLKEHSKELKNIPLKIYTETEKSINSIHEGLTEFEKIVTARAVKAAVENVTTLISNSAPTTVVNSAYDPTHKIDFTARVMETSEIFWRRNMNLVQSWLGPFLDYMSGSQHQQQPIKAVTRAGDCLALKQFEQRNNEYDESQQVYITIELYVPTIVSEVTIEHISQELCLNWESAPKEFTVFGSNNLAFRDALPLINGKFDDQGASLQTFKTQTASKSVRYVKFVIFSNYGADYTCIYRIRIHGNADLQPQNKVAISDDE